jgi:hypothetical protein
MSSAFNAFLAKLLDPCGVSHHTIARYLRPARKLPQLDSLFWLFLTGLDQFSIHGS